MIIEKTEKKLKKILMSQYIYQCDINDKYFLTRQISKLFPEVQIKTISNTVEQCFSLLKSPMSKDDFVRLFLDQLFITLEKELEI